MLTLERRRAGANFAEIGRELGISRQAARKRYLAAMARVAEDLAHEAHLTLVAQLDALDVLRAAVWNKAMEGDISAIAEARQLLSERGKLLGLYARRAENPVQIPSGFEERRIDALIDEAERRAIELKALPAGETRARPARPS